MTSRFRVMAAVLASVCLMASCLSDSDDNITYYDDAAITAVALGTVKCKREGSSYSYSASSFSIHIDQLGDRIYNVDSLVARTDLSSVPTTFLTKNNGLVALKNLSGTGYSYVSIGEAIDFTQERTVRVFSNDGNHFRDYRMSIVAHQEYADSFSWSRQPDCSIIQRYSSLKAVGMGGTVYVLGQTADGGYETALTTNGREWTGGTFPVASCAEASMAAHAGKLYILADGALYASDDAQAWTLLSTPAPVLKTLAGGCRDELYAIAADGGIMLSTDGGVTWAADRVAQSQYVDYSDVLPATDVCLVTAASTTNAEVGTATIVANCAEGGVGMPVVWNKVVDPDGDAQPWIYTTMSGENNAYRMPRMNKLSATCYADGIFAIGGDNPDRLYRSPDHGATWHTGGGMEMPEGFAAASGAAIVADGKGFIYLIGTGSATMPAQVWRGRQNKQTWREQRK